MYVLRRHEDGAYVAAPGSRGSYTLNLTRAQTFTTKESAESNACGNESAVRTDSLMRRPV